MNTTPEQHPETAPTLWTPSTLASGKRRIAEAIIHLEKEATIGLGPRTQLLPIGDCETIVAEIKERSAYLTTEVEAAEAARMLIGMYPARHVHDADIFSQC